VRVDGLAKPGDSLRPLARRVTPHLPVRTGPRAHWTRFGVGLQFPPGCAAGPP
jgi:hypothetical protein